VSDTANGGTFTVTISDGNNTYTFPGVQSGVPFALIPSPTVTTTYTWSVAGGGQNVCGTTSGSSGNFTVLVNPQPLANAGPDITVCNNSTVQLNGTGGTTYLWTPGTVLNNPNIFNPTLTVADTTITFTMITTNSNGCSDTDQVTVSLHQGVALANAGPDTPVCPGAAVVLQGSGTGNYNWYPATGLSSTNIANPTFTAGTTTTVYLEMTDQFNCRDTDEVVITMLPQPTAGAGPDQQVCPNTSVSLQATGGNTYNWYPTTGMSGSNTANPTVVVTATTSYYVIVSNGIGCTDTDAVTISVIQPPGFNIISDRNVCPEDSVMLYANGGETYDWFPEINMSGNGNDSVWVWPTDSTTYYVAITSSVCNTADTLPVNVHVLPLPNVQILQAGPKLCVDKFGQLAATGAYSYIWSPAASLDSAGSATPRSFATMDTWYTVTGYSEQGCSATDSALMRVEGDNLNGLFVPSVFSPNTDGKNDCYRILLPGGVSDYELHIYNRWGENVHNADDAGDCWDGTYRGEPCDVGVYFYYYKLKSPNCKAEMEGKGDITLVR
jgi:gliding motility-associated-like protein